MKRDIRPIIGLEIHVQLATQSKLFCACAVSSDASPNSSVCPVCLGHPGTLPVINRSAVERAILTGLALRCSLARHTKWDRKSYFYPDLPKNYQISQYDIPIAQDGTFDVLIDGTIRPVRIRRAHLEEDAGKNIHDTAGCTLIDLNRAGTPLLEIVTEPDLTSAEETYAFCVELQQLVTYLGVSEGNMQKGQMRFEPNVNVAILENDQEFRTPICEVKNLNSFRSVRDAIAFEIDRQIAEWESNRDYVLGTAPNENRGWNQDRGVTEFQRGKEAVQDYRYFPDPDLVPLALSDEWLSRITTKLPELPLARRARFVASLGLDEKDADTIVGHRATADLFEAVLVHLAPERQTPANATCVSASDAHSMKATTMTPSGEVATKQFVNAWLKLANDRGVPVTDLGIDAPRMAELARIAHDGTVNKTAANQLAEAMLERGESPTALANELGLVQIRDAGETESWVAETFAANESAVRDALNNPKKAKAATGFLRGQVMKISGGKADPRLVGELIEKRIQSMKRA